MSGDSRPPTAAETAPIEYDDWRDALTSGTLLGVACDDCGAVSATPKRVCGACGSRALTHVDLPQAGELYSETTIAVPPAGVEGPYRVGVVDLGPARLLARVAGDADVGDEVGFEGVIEELGRPAPLFAATD